MHNVVTRRSFAITVLTLSLCRVDAQAGSPSLTLEAIFSPDPEVQVEFGGSPAEGLTWAAAGNRYLQPSDQGEDYQPPLQVDAVTGESHPLFDAAKMVAALSALPDFPEQDAKRLTDGEVQLDPQQKALLIQRANDLFYYSLENSSAKRLTQDPDEEEIACFSPDSRWVAFVRNNELLAVEVDSGREVALTEGAGPELFNGKLDWVYQEEIYGRGDFKGYWWNPDSSLIAYLQLDESPVHRFTLIDHLPIRGETEIVHYPKAGDPNPRVRLGVVSPKGGESVWVDTSKYAAQDHLIVRVDWNRDGGHIVFLVQDREQTWLDINLADPETGSMTTLLHETSPAFVDVDLTGKPYWLADGSFLWMSGRSGYHHLYHFEPSGAIRRQLTSGEWEVRELYGADEADGWIYFAASEHSPIEVHPYRMRMDGSKLERLSSGSGTHRVDFDPTFSHYIDTWSDYDTPPKVHLYRADGRRVRTIDDNPVPILAESDLAAAEFLQVPAPDGFLFEAALIKPPDFDPKKKYPVLQYNYGGPHAQTVRNAWGGSRHMWFRYLAQEGYIVWMCDNRSASGKGIWPTWEAYQRMGHLELEDLESCLSWLKAKPWVDPERIGVYGGSYGGFMAAFALTHSKSFKAGIAFAPVTDWHLYDTIYTERYMRRPQNNPEGYESTSVIKAADRLHGRLLLAHGTMDDNVHLQNTVKLANALQLAGKSFDLMLYPTARHGVRDDAQIYHWYELMTRFLLTNL